MINVICQRRSIRKYTAESIPPAVLLEFVKAGMNAPSAGDEQPWQFVVVTDPATLRKIPEFHPHSRMLKDAPAAICVCGDLALQKHRGFWVQDCSAATENILLEIAGQGYGGVWIGVYPVMARVRRLRKLLKMPKNIVPFSLVGVGWPAEVKEPKNTFLPDRVRMEKWG
jgi:nitroreductase